MKSPVEDPFLFPNASMRLWLHAGEVLYPFVYLSHFCVSLRRGTCSVRSIHHYGPLCFSYALQVHLGPVLLTVRRHSALWLSILVLMTPPKPELQILAPGLRRTPGQYTAYPVWCALRTRVVRFSALVAPRTSRITKHFKATPLLQ